MIKKYTLEYWREDDWFVGRIIEIPGLFNQGKSLDELEANLYDAYFLLMDEGVPPEGVETEKIDFEIDE
ncbi:MAG TPA: type II toxin-antitoxin system HicB family antitoxin [candidate division Zixibacteria bacterium]|nr:type II toxin-antitoxin system HicB family antitoxin [candidate division Zixibacteria bacterium]